jgi:hypothetical protein
VPFSIVTRLRVRTRRFGLDARLARGEDPIGDPALELRAAQLCRLRNRERVADALMLALARAEHRSASLSAAIPVRREAVSEGRPAVLQLAIVLRKPGPVCAQGVALARRLLWDGNGPLYSLGEPGALHHEARRALLALQPAPVSVVSQVHHVEV